MIYHRRSASAARGMVLISSLLLLVVVTLLAVGLFRSFGIGEKIAGNTREKQLALNAAESAEQYAEWWISTGANGAGIVVTPTCVPPFVSAAAGLVCQNALTNVTSPPWTIGVNYILPTIPNLPATFFNLYRQPDFYIQKLVPVAQGNLYQIVAVGYGGSPSAVAVVEATVICTQKIFTPSGPGNGGTANSVC